MVSTIQSRTNSGVLDFGTKGVGCGGPFGLFQHEWKAASWLGAALRNIEVTSISSAGDAVGGFKITGRYFGEKVPIVLYGYQDVKGDWKYHFF